MNLLTCTEYSSHVEERLTPKDISNPVNVTRAIDWYLQIVHLEDICFSSVLSVQVTFLNISHAFPLSIMLTGPQEVKDS